MNRKEWEREQMKEIFDNANAEGAQKFGGLWLSATEGAVVKATGIYDLNDLQVKSLISLSILAALKSYDAAMKREPER